MQTPTVTEISRQAYVDAQKARHESRCASCASPCSFAATSTRSARSARAAAARLDEPLVSSRRRWLRPAQALSAVSMRRR
jgi:hypothetical protein